MTNPILALLHHLLQIYEWVVIATVIFSWLSAFNVVNMSNNFIRQVGYVLSRLTEPLLRPIRNALPEMGGIDLSPVVLLLALWFTRYSIDWIFYSL